MSKIFVTSDLHLGHWNIVKYCGRPFKSVEHMNEVLIRNWNQRVKPEDTIIHVGDFCFKNTPGGKDGEGALNRADFYINQLNGRKVFIRGNHDCFSIDTRLLTIDGYKTYDQVKIGDSIPTVNLSTGCVEYQPIAGIVINTVDEAYIIKNKSFDGIFSKNHRHYLVPFNSNTRGMKWYSDKCKWKVNTSQNVVASCYAFIPTTFRSGNCGFDISDDWLRLFAWIHTDGHVDKHGYVSISQSKPAHVENIKKLLDRLGLTYRFVSRSRPGGVICGKKVKAAMTGHEFHFRAEMSKKIQSVLCLGRGKFASWLRELSDSQMKTLSCYLIDGDGSYTNGGSAQMWGCKEILDYWMGLFVTHNIDCSVVFDGRSAYYLCIHQAPVDVFSARQIMRKHMHKITTSQVMWDVTVSNHIIFVERNGKPFITGNSNNSLNTKIVNLVLEYGDKHIKLVHRPEHADAKYPINFVGHVHQIWKYKRIRQGEDFTDLINVGVDVNKFMPITVDEALSGYRKWLKTFEASGEGEAEVLDERKHTSSQ